jgi:hypothetical protein
MTRSFGIAYQSPSRLWADIRKGPPLHAVREHLDRVVNFRRFAATEEDRDAADRR